MGVIFVLLFTIHNYFLSIRSMPFFILIALMLTVVALLKNYQQQRRMIVLRYFWANYTFVKPKVSDHRGGDGGKNEFSLEKTNSQFVMASESAQRFLFKARKSEKKSPRNRPWIMIHPEAETPKSSPIVEFATTSTTTQKLT